MNPGELAIRIVGIVFPIFAIVGAGFAYARWKRAHGGIDMSFANQLNMDVFVPALVFAALVSKSFDLGVYWKLAVGALVIVLGSGLLAWPLARLLKVAPKTFVPPMMFTNSGNMGLPLAVLAFGEAALPAAVMLFLVENILHYTLGTWMLDHHARLANLWKVPVIAASLAGLAFSIGGIAVWSPLHTAIRLTGDIAIPLLLFSLGVRLTDSTFKDIRLGLIGAVACPLFGMAFAWPAAMLLDLPAQQAGMLLVFGALPPAVLNFVFAEKYAQEPEKVASMVMIGNLGALVFIPVALAMVLG